MSIYPSPGQFGTNDLPGLHIDYEDPSNIHFIFDGVDVILGPDIIRDYMNSDPAPDRYHLSRYLAFIYKKQRDLSPSDEFCELMADKMIAKLRRLPHTNAWMLHHS